MIPSTLSSWFSVYKEPALKDRYIHNGYIEPLLARLQKELAITELGSSENGLPIRLIKIGKGEKKLLFWSQMHGNESTTTKALFDFINLLLDTTNRYGQDILNACTLYVVPILNPDGAFAYTRLNFNTIDLNRDAQDRTQKESKILRDLITGIRPDFAFNLHGQRTIFSAGATSVPATVSFLSPAGDPQRSLLSCRKIAMEVIVAMNTVLQQFIPGGVGRYDDGFNNNCIGDTLSTMGIPTILFEAGHFPKDYEREKSREFIFYALFSGCHYIAGTTVDGSLYTTYFEIPENGKYLYDILIRDVLLQEKNVDIAIQYKEELFENRIKFVPVIEKIAELSSFYGHREIIGKGREIRSENDTVEVVPGNELLRFSLNDEIFSTELIKT